MIQQIVDAINQTAQAAGVDATGFTSAPTAPSSIDVKASGGTAHVTLQDTSSRTRLRTYFVEADTSSAFDAPHVFQLGAGREAFLPLPGLNDDSDQQNWYFRAYSMDPGSEQSSEKIYFGGQSSPTEVNVGGSVALTPLASTGAGTASTLGGQAGQGFGTAQVNRGGTNSPVTV